MQQQAFIPKARLIQVLGEHLIKDATVGLLELVKNSYDADATRVRIVMSSLNTPQGQIVIEDNGSGMNVQTFITTWMNPATGHKQVQKDRSQRTMLGRLPLGEKGVGRFATQQIGSRLLMVSKTEDMTEELFVEIDWSQFENPEKDLADVKVTFTTRAPVIFLGTVSGTHLEISGLKTQWQVNDIDSISNALKRMKSPFKGANDFDVTLKFEHCPDAFKNYENLEWSDILERAHYRFFGIVDRSGILEFEYDFNMPGFDKNHSEDQLSLVERFGFVKQSDTICGGFIVNFHVYDKTKRFLAASGVKDNDLREISGISVYRDGMRILPYGERRNDWLRLDYRRIQSPGTTISNDQIIGMVEINQIENAVLKDKTNREGLIENDAYFGFERLVSATVQTLEKEMLADRQKTKPGKEKPLADDLDRMISEVKDGLGRVVEKVKNSSDPVTKNAAGEIALIADKQIEDLRKQVGDQADNYQVERNTLLSLAGTGLAAERFTHEFARLVSGANAALDRLVRQVDLSNPKVKKEADAIRGALEALRNDIRLLGPMFYIKRVAREKELDLKQVVDNTISLQELALGKERIKVDIIGASFRIIMREGSCMQVFNNLIDNSVFWLSKKSEQDKRAIRIILDDSHKSVYVTDSGPGVVARYKDKIFEPFFSMKGEDGRGLGLYISREILQEKHWGIFLVDKGEHPELLNGASFKIVFSDSHE